MILVNSVGKSFSGTNVLRDINIEVADSSIYGLVGFTAPTRAKFLPTWAKNVSKP